MLNFIKTNSPIVICDIGASSIDPTPFIDDLLNNTDSILYGFEPNQDEFKKLLNNEKKKYFNFGVGDGNDQKLNICSAPGMTSILEPDIDYLNYFHGFTDWAKIIKKTHIKTKKLDDILFEKEIDFFKIDVQGYEYEIINYGKKKISNSLAIQIETSPIPLYLKEKTFSYIGSELEKLGFSLHMFNHINSRSFKPIILENNIFNGLNHLFQLDCVFIKNIKKINDLSLDQLKKMALILFYSFKSYDLVYIYLKRISDLENKDYTTEYLALLSKLKIIKKY